MPSVWRALEPVASLYSGMPNRMNDLMPRSRASDFVYQRVGAELEVTRHRPDLLTHAFAGAHEQGQDEVARREFRLADQLADERVVPQPPRPGGREV